MSPRKRSPEPVDPQDDELTDEEDAYERERCDRIPGSKEHWDRVDKMPIGGTVPPGLLM